MRYQLLFVLQVRHAGYGDGRCEHAQIVARSDPSGERALARHRLLVRARPHGIEVLARVDGQGDALRSTVALETLSLGFELRAIGSDFATNTDLSAWANTTGVPQFETHAGQLQLTESGPSAEPGVLARIDVHGVSESWLAAPPTFTLELAPRSTLWVYYLLTKRGQGEDPHIEDGDRKHPLAFVRKRLTAANTPASVDPIGAGLLQRNPEHRCHRLVSKRPVAWRQAARRQLSLYLGDELLIRELATPSSRNFAMLAKPPRETLYHVVVY